jgi:hypothetical protein
MASGSLARKLLELRSGQLSQIEFSCAAAAVHYFRGRRTLLLWPDETRSRNATKQGTSTVSLAPDDLKRFFRFRSVSGESAPAAPAKTPDV